MLQDEDNQTLVARWLRSALIFVEENFVVLFLGSACVLALLVFALLVMACLIVHDMRRGINFRNDTTVMAISGKDGSGKDLLTEGLSSAARGQGLSGDSSGSEPSSLVPQGGGADVSGQEKSPAQLSSQEEDVSEKGNSVEVKGQGVSDKESPSIPEVKSSGEENKESSSIPEVKSPGETSLRNSRPSDSSTEGESVVLLFSLLYAYVSVVEYFYKLFFLNLFLPGLA